MLVKFQTIINEYDEDGSGRIEFPEFLTMMARKAREEQEKEHLHWQEVFRVFTMPSILPGTTQASNLHKLFVGWKTILQDKQLQVRRIIKSWTKNFLGNESWRPESHSLSKDFGASRIRQRAKDHWTWAPYWWVQVMLIFYSRQIFSMNLILKYFWRLKTTRVDSVLFTVHLQIFTCWNFWFRFVMSSLNISGRRIVSMEEVDEMINAVDDGDGRLDFQEFTKLLTK